MKGTETQIQNKFLKLLNKYKIDEIDVNMLCESLNIRRQTFYYHYKNLYDVIYSVFYLKKMEPTNPKDLNKLLDDVINFLFEDENFNREINDSNAKDILSNFLVSFLFHGLYIYLNRFKLGNETKREVGRFIANSAIGQILYYFKDEELSKAEIKENIKALVNNEVIEKLISTYKKSKLNVL